MSNPANERVRAATAAALAAYTATGSGLSRILTANANGALAAVDGVTLIAGDLLLLTLGAAAADNGIYIVTTVGDVGTKYVLTRAPSFQQGTAVAGYMVDVTEGTLFAGQQFKLMTTGAITLDITGLTFYPRFSQASGTLANGTLAMTALYVGPNAKFNVVPNGAPVNPGFCRVSASSSVAPATGTATVTSTSGTDASPFFLQIINF